MPMMLMAFVLPALLAVVVIVFVRKRAQQLREVLVTVARREKGRVEKGPMGLYPLARIPVDGAEVLLSGSQGGKTRRSATFAWIGCEAYGETTLDISCMPGRVGMLERMGREKLQTDQSRFNEIFWLADGEQDTARELLDDELREALMAIDPSLRVRLSIGTLLAFPDGWRTGETEPSLEVSVGRFPASVEVALHLVKVARLVHERLGHGRQARAA